MAGAKRIAIAGSQARQAGVGLGISRLQHEDLLIAIRGSRERAPGVEDKCPFEPGFDAAGIGADGGIAVGIALFAVLGTVTAVWAESALFKRRERVPPLIVVLPV